ncbi:MAG: TOBE domain-containing protein [Crocinitomicaceae bacterium]|nr:TOBE domain-containing protein [Crocinitomicaceae bacterium]
MNKLKATVSSVKSNHGISVVQLEVSGNLIKALIVNTENEAFKVKADEEVHVLFKETEVVLAKEESVKVGISNKLECTVKRIEIGEILSQVEMDCQGGMIKAVLLTELVQELDVKQGDNVWALIKSNEIIIST